MRQRNFEGQQDTSTNHKLGVFPNPTEVIHNVATNATERPMQPSETPWINKDPHSTTTSHHSREEERRNTEDDYSDWEVDNLDWNVLEHPPHKGTITDNILQELTPQFEEAPSPPLNNPQLIKKETTEKEKQAPNHGGITHERLNSRPTLESGQQEDLTIIYDDPVQQEELESVPKPTPLPPFFHTLRHLPSGGNATKMHNVIPNNKKKMRLKTSLKPEQNTIGLPLPTKLGRGLRNTGYMCFLDATIQCLGAIDELNETRTSTNKPLTTQGRLLLCIRELQKMEPAYTPSPLIQHIPSLIRYKKGEPADAHEFLIVLINDVSEPISQLFQGQMSSTVKCSLCERSTISTDNTQDISLQIDEDGNLSIENCLHDFFQSGILEGGNAYWCGTCKKTCRAIKTFSYTRTPTILIIHSERLILRKKIQTHISFDTTLDLEPYMTPRPPQPRDMKLVGIISHHGTKDNGHYTAITRRGDEWTLLNDAIAVQTPMLQIHQTRAYILMYRKTEPRVETMETEPKDGSQKQKSQSLVIGDLNPRPGKRQKKEIPAPQPDFLT